MRLLTIHCRIIFRSQWMFLSPNLLGMRIAPDTCLPVAIEHGGPKARCSSGTLLLTTQATQ